MHASLEATLQLKLSERPNVLYDLAKGLGTLRADHSDTLFPRERMPMGLLQYMTVFFLAEHKNQVCHFFDSGMYNYIIRHLVLCRYLSVRLTTDISSRRCMYNLARSGCVYTMGLCEMSSNAPKLNTNKKQLEECLHLRR